MRDHPPGVYLREGALGRNPGSRVMGNRGRFPRAIILPEGIDGRERQEGTQGAA